MTLLYINVTRMVLAQMLGPNKDKILSANFLEKLSQVKTDKEMEDFVKNEFVPLIRFPGDIPNVKLDNLNWDRIGEPMDQICKYLLKNVSLTLRGRSLRG